MILYGIVTTQCLDTDTVYQLYRTPLHLILYILHHYAGTAKAEPTEIPALDH